MGGLRYVTVVGVLTAASLVVPASVVANPAGKTTLNETISVTNTPGSFFQPRTGPGEGYVVRGGGGLGHGRERRAARRRALLTFGQITDPQVADSQSPARAEWAQPAGPLLTGTWRPQEALGTRAFDSVIRNLNANRVSPVRDGRGRRQRAQFVVSTGDSPDNQQLNESTWFLEVLRGGRVDPFSGKPVSAQNPCTPLNGEPVTPELIARLNADVAGRHYSGVQDYDDYPTAPADRKGAFWDPDVRLKGRFRAFPSYPGLMERAMQPHTAQGLRIPWYQSRGNHDGLIGGGTPATSPLIRTVGVGCTKIFPSATFDPKSLRGLSVEQVFERIGDLVPQLLAGAKVVPSDPDRRFISKLEYKRLHAGPQNDHGFGLVARDQNTASRGNASYYAWSPKSSFRMIAIDTVAEAGGCCGNMDDPQYRWLARELDRNSATEIRNGRVVTDGDPNRLIVLYGHHTLRTLTTPTPDEEAGVCTDPLTPGCDSDPRRSTPIHLGTTGPQNLLALLQRFPNVIAYVVGHTHHNTITPWPARTAPSGFWEINTASHVDFPQQSRLIDVMDNRDGSLSLFGTIVDSAAPVAVPPSGTPAASLSDSQIASISRAVAGNNPSNYSLTAGPGPYNRPADRNVELLIEDPRDLVAPLRPIRPFTGSN